MPRKKAKRGKTVRASRKRPTRSTRTVSKDKKVKLIVKNLILFGVLFVLSLLLYVTFTVNELLSDLFLISALLTGFIEVALVITYLVFFFLKSFKK